MPPLRSVALREGAAALLLAVAAPVAWSFEASPDRTARTVALALPVALLAIGACFWGLKDRTLRRRERLSASVVRGFRVLRVAAVAAMVAGAIVLVARVDDRRDAVWCGALYAFALVELCHYFVVRLTPSSARFRRGVIARELR